MDRITLKSPLRRKLGIASLAAVMTSLARAAPDPWPKAKALRVLNGFTAGSATDVIARAVAPEIARNVGALGAIVENKPGAGGSIAAAQLVTAPSDGYTLFITSSAHAINPAFFPHLSYDTLRDITGVGPVGSSMFVMVTNERASYRTVSDVVNKAKAQPGRLSYGSGGVGSGSHLNSAKLAAATGIDVVHVPFKGTTEALNELLADRLDWIFLPAPTTLPMLKSGKIRALAVGPATRSMLLPTVPSMTEAGYPDAALSSWVGVFVSSKTPASIVDQLSTALAESVALPSVREQLLRLGTEPMPMAAGQFNAFVRGEVMAMAKLVKDANIKPNE